MAEKKRRFNIIDLVIVLVVIGLLFGGYYKFFRVDKGNPTVKSETKEMEYTLFINEVRQESVDAIDVDANIFETKSGLFLGTIVKKDVMDAKATMLIKNEYIEAKVPNRYDILLTIKAPIVDKANGYFIDGTKELKRQSEYAIKSKNFQVVAVAKDIKSE